MYSVVKAFSLWLFCINFLSIAVALSENVESQNKSYNPMNYIYTEKTGLNNSLNDEIDINLINNTEKTSGVLETVEDLSTDSKKSTKTFSASLSEDVSTDCPSLENTDSLTQTEFIKVLTNPCRYDKQELPEVQSGEPVKTVMRFYINTIDVLDSSNLHFAIQGVLQLRYDDARLAYETYAPKRSNYIVGGAELLKLIWAPHIYISNEQVSVNFGIKDEDTLTSIENNGTVVIAGRIQTKLSCGTDLNKFPFDEQDCTTIFGSWMYNASNLMLYWNKQYAVTLNPKISLTDYTLANIYSNETMCHSDGNGMTNGLIVGNYSTISFTVCLTREYGYYIMEYFLPSMMIVAISWVSFWLQPDQTPARTTFGTSTLLSFITLSSSQASNLTKLNYIKVSEIWFFGCTFFIISSLVEFAFVNTIWRRNRNIELKKVNSKYIFKSTLTPSPSRSKIHTSESSGGLTMLAKSANNCSSNCLTVETPTIVVNEMPLHPNNLSLNRSVSNISSIEDNYAEDNKDNNYKPWSTMTPREVSLWIDRKARFVFPLAFIIFNGVFWTIVFCL